MRRILIAAVFATTLLSCAYEQVFGAASATKAFVETAYDEYSDELRNRIIKCQNSTSLEEFEYCVGRGFRPDDHRKILAALTAYKTASEALTEVMLEDTNDKKSVRKAFHVLYVAALAVVDALPNTSANALAKELGPGRRGIGSNG